MTTPATPNAGLAHPGDPEPAAVGRPSAGGEGSARASASRATRPNARDASPAIRTLAFLAVVASLYLGRAVLVPVALAALVAFLLAPIAKALEKVRIPRAVAAAASVLALAVGLLAVVWVSGAQAVDLARRLPEYRKTLDAKLSFLRTGGLASPIVDASERLKELGSDLSAAPATPATPAPGAAPGRAPAPRAPVIPVRIVPDERAPLELFGDVIGSVLGPLGEGAIVILLAIFLLAYRTDVRERLLALGSAPRLGVTSQALEEAGKRVARYLLSNLAVNALYGTAVGLGVYLIGLPNAPLWGLLCALLRFIPYVGTWMGAALPLAVSVAVFDGWGRTGAVFATVLGIDVVVGNVVEPLVYGHRTGISPLAVVLATVFWTWVWGVPGLLLAVPMTLCLAVVGRYVPGFGVFHVLLGSEPVLDPAERVYERLIAFDAAGATRILSEKRAAGTAVVSAEETLIGVLRRAELDRREGHVDEERYLSICDGVREVVEGLEAPAPAAASVGAVLCLPAFAEADRVACEVLARHLGASGLSVSIGPMATTTSDAVPRAVRGGALAACVVALPPFAGLRVRYGVRRARSQEANVPLVGVVLDPGADRLRTLASLRQAGATGAAFTLADAQGALLPHAAPVDTPRRLDGAVVEPGDASPPSREPARA